MTYGFKVKTSGGEAVVDGVYGDLPDGEFEVSGHAQPPQIVSGGHTVSSVNIQITQRDAEGRYVTAAQHYHQQGA